MSEGWPQWHSFFGRLTAAIAGTLNDNKLSGDGQSNPNRVHLFAGQFEDDAAMFAYCFTPITPNGPERLNLDLPGASIDTGQIDAARGDQVLARLSEYFGRKQRRAIMGKMKPGEAIILIPMGAFMGREFELNNTPRLRHIGYEDSLAPAAVEAAR